ncbi:MAG: MATE family efflux transporter [Eubacteriales bacterium]
MKENILGVEKIPKLYVAFVVPAIISMVIVGIQTMIDGIFLGNFVNTNALASVNIVQPYMQLIIGSSMVVSIGSLSFMGRSLGEENYRRAKDIFKTAFISMAVISIVILFIGVLFNRQLSGVLGANEVLLEGSSIYMKMIAFFAPVMSLMFLFGFTDRVIGKPQMYLIAMISSTIINIGLDYLLIKQLQLGIKGAAFATGVSFFVSLFVVAKPLLNRKSVINIYDGKFDPLIMKTSIENGSSEGVSSFANAVTVFVFNTAFMTASGEAGVAAFTAISYIGQFGILIMFGISDGIGAIVSYNYGALKRERVKETLKIATTMNFIIGAILFLILFFYGKDLVSIFTVENEEVINLAARGSKIYAFSFLLVGFNIIKSGYYTSIGKVLASIFIASGRGIIFIIIGSIILPRIFGLSGIWLTIPFAEGLTVILCIILSRYERKEYFISKSINNR